MIESETALDPTGRTLAGRDGVTQPTRPPGAGGFLSDVIVEMGFADSETVEGALEEARQSGIAVEDVLLERGELTGDQLARSIAERRGLPYVDLERFDVDESAQALISRTMALRYRAMPIAFAPDGALAVALADPLDALAVSDIAVTTKSELRPVVASAAAITALAEQMPAEPLAVSRPSLLLKNSSNVGSVLDAAESPNDADASAAQTSIAPPPRAGTGPRFELQDRIAELIDEALEAERASRVEAERLRDEERAAGEAIAEALEKAEDEIRNLTDQVQSSEERFRDLKSDHDGRIAKLVDEALEGERAARVEAERLREEESAAKEAAASALEKAKGEVQELIEHSEERFRDLRAERDAERERRVGLEKWLRDRLERARLSGDKLGHALDGLDSAVSETRVASEPLTSLFDELTGEPGEPAD